MGKLGLKCFCATLLLLQNFAFHEVQNVDLDLDCFVIFLSYTKITRTEKKRQLNSRFFNFISIQEEQNVLNNS